KEQRVGITQKFVLLLAADLANELDVATRRAEEGLNHLLVIGAVDRVHLGGHLQLHAGLQRDLDGLVRSLLGRDASKEGQVLARLAPKRVQSQWQSVVYCADPVREC